MPGSNLLHREALTTCLDSYELELTSQGKQPATIRSYMSDLRIFFDYLNANSHNAYKTVGDLHRLIEYETLKTYQDYLFETEQDKANSIRRKIISIRLFFRFLSQYGFGESPFDEFPIPFREEFVPSALNTDDLELLIDEAALNPHPIKRTRDPALIALLGMEGLKASELIELCWKDFLHSKDWSSLRVPGKNSRVISLSSASTKLLMAYREALAELGRLDANNFIFMAFKGRDGLTSTPQISRHGVKFVLYELGEKVGFKSLNSEHLRQYAICWLSKIGRSPDEIMEHFGLKRIARIALQARIFKDADKGLS